MIFDINSINTFFNWQFWAFFGIVLEIIGFILMTFLWGKHPTMEQYHKWFKNQELEEWRHKNVTVLGRQKAFDEKKWYTRLPWSILYIDEIVKEETKFFDKWNVIVRHKEVPNRFHDIWILKTKVVSIIPVIVGLGFQGFQIINF